MTLIAVVLSKYKQPWQEFSYFVNIIFLPNNYAPQHPKL